MVRFFPILTLGMVLILGWNAFAENSPQSSRPNIVMILADDLGYGDVQCNNPKRGKIKTPHLDRLAMEGMRFVDAHSGSSVCTPTRYGLLTGRYAWRTRLQSGVLDGGNDEPLIAKERLTLAQFLKNQGYRTACLGKWHLGFQSESETRKKGGQGMGKNGLPLGASIIGGPTTRGFDRFFGCSNARTMGSLIEGNRVIETIEPSEMLPRLEREAIQFVHDQRGQKDVPFFLYLPLTSPHTPIVPTPAWQGKSGLGAYADFVMMTDSVVGNTLAAIEQMGLAKDTLVLFSSDNGCSPQADTDALEKQGHFASERFRGYKADIWDGGHRVPFFVRWPGVISPNAECQQLICLTDLFATMAELLQQPLPDDAAEDSFSFLPALLSKESTSRRESIVHHSIQGRFSIRKENWKLNLCPGSGGWGKPNDQESTRLGNPPYQLYDLDKDPSESRNVLKDHPDKGDELHRLLESLVQRGRSTPGKSQANDVQVNIEPKELR